MSRYYSTSYHYSAKPYRIPYRKSYGFIIMAIIVLLMSWESQKMDAAVATGDIPTEAIRLRILANSDSAADQMVKRIVRDEVVKAMNGWATGPQTIEEARKTIESKMPELESIVAGVLKSRGFAYTSSAQLGMVDFPTKMYGNKVYPAGQYEALLITIGEGKGQNWWCVLFPPLCFVDAATGEASAAADQPANATADSDVQTAKAGSDFSDQGEAAELQQEQEKVEAPKAKFFIWEMLQKLFDWIKSLF
ncbi:stage II sporulation protein R [Paenibacillus sp. LHD-117]|uniref:stage II sporulation protein R n=1 Tax=Paenibacillus sp. LHD-117 TaxID=3071412 RepID=UPI0027E1C148|nr:stage II sporulation protein R [Paenibacillus sp. LHD-117]MDQ6420994.1 stage II sporulation protein R [Paenibacillus sp. LHD-117]